MGANSIAGTDNAKLLTGKGSRYTESGSFQLGDRARYTESGSIQVGDKGTLKTGTDLSGATIQQGSTVTIGETGVGALFSDTIKTLFGQQQENTATLLSALTSSTSSTPTATGSPDLTTEPAPADASSTKRKLIVAGVLVALVAGLWWLIKRK